MKEKKNILIISYHFAPSSAIGAKRFAFLSQIFHDKIFNIHFLAPTEETYLEKDYSFSYSGSVHRVGLFPSYPFKRSHNQIQQLIKKNFTRLWTDYLCLIDNVSGWIIPSLIKGVWIIKKHHIDAIISTGPPHSPMITAYILSRLSGAKLILDYRDPWKRRSFFPRLFGKKICAFIEKLVSEQASAFVFVTNIMKDWFIEDFGEIHRDKCHLINNGFHPTSDITPLHLEKDKKTILYAGNFSEERKVSLLLQPLMQLINDNEITKDDFKIHIFGTMRDDDKQIIEASGLGETVVEHQVVGHEMILRYMKGADILFLPSATNVRYAIPGKFYYYLSVQKPILAVAPRGSAVDHIMKEVDCGEFAEINKEDSIKKHLRKILIENPNYTFSGSDKYTWDKIADKYVRVISDVLGN